MYYCQQQSYEIKRLYECLQLLSLFWRMKCAFSQRLPFSLQLFSQFFTRSTYVLFTILDFNFCFGCNKNVIEIITFVYVSVCDSLLVFLKGLQQFIKNTYHVLQSFWCILDKLNWHCIVLKSKRIYYSILPKIVSVANSHYIHVYWIFELLSSSGTMPFLYTKASSFTENSSNTLYRPINFQTCRSERLVELITVIKTSKNNAYIIKEI